MTSTGVKAQSLWNPVADYPEDDCPSGNHYTGTTITPLFGEVEVEADGVSRAYADKCVAFLHHIPDALLNTMLRATMYYREKVTGEKKTYCNPTDILKEVSANHAAIDEELDVAGVSLSMNCDWEEEHGMAWAFTENEVIYVGPFDSMILARGVSEYSLHLRMPPEKQVTAKKPAGKGTTAKKAPPKQTVKRNPAKKTAAKATIKKAAAKKATAKTAGKRTAVKKPTTPKVAKKASAKKSTVKKTPAQTRK